MVNKYTFRIICSEDDYEYVGLCTELPSLSWLDKSQDNAFKGIRKLVEDVIKDLKANDEPIPEPFSEKEFRKIYCSSST